MKKDNKNTRYIVFNNTDGIPASCDCHGDGSMTREEAEKFVKEFPLRYKKQGYYRTNRWEKIPPELVDLEIRPLTMPAVDKQPALKKADEREEQIQIMREGKKNKSKGLSR